MEVCDSNIDSIYSWESSARVSTMSMPLFLYSRALRALWKANRKINCLPHYVYITTESKLSWRLKLPGQCSPLVTGLVLRREHMPSQVAMAISAIRAQFAKLALLVKL